MKDETGWGIVFVADYGYSRISNKAELDRCISLHRRMLRRRFWKRLFISVVIVLVLIFVLVLSVGKNTQTTNTTSTPTPISQETTLYFPFIACPVPTPPVPPVPPSDATPSDAMDYDTYLSHQQSP